MVNNVVANSTLEYLAKTLVTCNFSVSSLLQVIDSEMLCKNIVSAGDLIVDNYASSIVASDMLEHIISGFEFTRDDALKPYIEGWKDIDWPGHDPDVKPMVKSFIGKISGRHNFACAQSFCYEAILKSRFKLKNVNGKAIADSEFSIPILNPTLLGTIIPFEGYFSDEFFYVSTNPWWGHPSSIIDFANKRFWCDESVPIERGDVKVYVRHMAINIFAYLLTCLAFGYRQWIEDPRPKESCLLIGGIVNPSHIIWNYLGGLYQINQHGLSSHVSSCIVMNDLLVRDPIQCRNLLEFSTETGISRLVIMARNGYMNARLIRVSDAGVNPDLCQVLVSREYTLFDNSQITDSFAVSSALKAAPPLFSLGEQNETDSTKVVAQSRVSNELIAVNGAAHDRTTDEPRQLAIVMSIRSRRQLVDQTDFYASLICRLGDKYKNLHVIFDGSVGQSQASLCEGRIVSDIKDQVKLFMSTSCIPSTVEFTSLIGESFERQVHFYAFADTFVSYLSGGCIKVTDFCKHLGVVLAPICDVTSNSCRSLGQVVNNTDIDGGLAANIFEAGAQFWIGHDRYGYQANILPLRIVVGSAIASFSEATPFSVDNDVAITAILQCIDYNSSRSAAE